MRFDSATLLMPAPSLQILKDIQVGIGNSGGTIATISVIEQGFTVVPEPGTAALIATGLSMLAAAGRRRGARASRTTQPVA